MLSSLRAKIIVADGNKNSLEATHALFFKEGYHVEKALRLNDVFQCLQLEKIDVLILDVYMPEMKGYEAIPMIRGIDPHLPIIITAEENSLELESQVRQQRVFYYHVKSFGLEELKLAVENAIQKSSQKNPLFPARDPGR
jgi:DNA-binding NtrC family response regulator